MIAIADHGNTKAFHAALKQGLIVMNAGKPVRSTDKLEKFSRGALALALLAALAWALL